MKLNCIIRLAFGACSLLTVEKEKEVSPGARCVDCGTCFLTSSHATGKSYDLSWDLFSSSVERE